MNFLGPGYPLNTTQISSKLAHWPKVFFACGALKRGSGLWANSRLQPTKSQQTVLALWHAFQTLIWISSQHEHPSCGVHTNWLCSPRLILMRFDRATHYHRGHRQDDARHSCSWAGRSSLPRSVRMHAAFTRHLHEKRVSLYETGRGHHVASW